MLFQGEVKKIGDHKYEAYGRAERIDAKTIEISELPIHKWTQDFKGELEALCGEKGDGPLKVSLIFKFTSFSLTPFEGL